MRKPIIKNLLFLLLVSLLFIPSCSSSSPSYEALADSLHSLKPYDQTYGNSNDSEYTNFQIEAGLRATDNGKRPFDTDSLNEFLLNDEFLSIYVDKYGLFDLLDHFNVYLVNSEVFGDYDKDAYTSEYVGEVKSRNEKIRSAITNLSEYKALETGVFDTKAMESLHGSKGYYGGKKDEIKEGEKQTGEFNNAQNDNAVYKSSRTDKTEKKYYGDWAVEYSVKYNYNQGKYGWNNGVFEDESPTWEETSNLIVYYKDSIVIREDNTTEGSVYIPYGIIDNKMFCWMYSGYDVVGIRWIDNYTPPETELNSNERDGVDEEETSSVEISKAEVIKEGKYVISIGELEEKLLERFKAVNPSIKDVSKFDTDGYLSYQASNNDIILVKTIPKDDTRDLSATIKCFVLYTETDKDYSDYLGQAINLTDPSVDAAEAASTLSAAYRVNKSQDDTSADGSVNCTPYTLGNLTVAYGIGNMQMCVITDSKMDINQIFTEYANK